MKATLLLAFVVGLAGCASNPPPNIPAVALGPGSNIPQKDAVLIAGRSGAMVALKPKGTVTVELQSNPAAGYYWRLAKPLDPSILALKSSPETLPPIALAPSGPVTLQPERWVFQSVGPGTAKVRMVYTRPGQSLSDVVTYDFTVNAE